MADSLAASKSLSPAPSSKVRVVVRIRPFLPTEIASEKDCPNSCITLDQEHCSGEEVTVFIKDQWSRRNEYYKLDSFFGQNDDLGQIFHREVSGVIPGILRGFNATVFAYGATGSGKTYTMQGTDVQPGLIPLAMSTILSLRESCGGSVEISYYEIYMDRCYDLLEPKTKEIPVLEDKDGQVQLKGLCRVLVNSMQEFHEIFSSGVQRRKVAHTGLNDQSSRSHGVLTVVLQIDGVTGKLNLVDLAGNEDNRRTCNEGIRLQESAKINQSLFSLSNVIYALNNNELRVPYRASKLTRILQDSLGGSSRALMIACLNPGSYQEAVHTVSLAARSRQIVNPFSSDKRQDTPKVKMDMEERLRIWLESKGKLKSLQRLNGPFSPFLSKTPKSVRYLKNTESVRDSAKSNIHDQSVSKGRKLFDSGNPLVASMEERLLLADSIGGDISLSSGYPSFSVKATIPCGEYSKDQLETINSKCCTEQPETRPVNYQLEYLKITQKEGNPVGADFLKPMTFLPESSNKENIYTQLTSPGGSPATSRKIREQQGWLKVLSPIRTTMTPSRDMPFIDRPCSDSLDPKTPKTPYVVTCDGDDEFQMAGTPLDKFTAQGSSLKESLIQEYLAFLSVASKEELLALKGIGQKRAEYILQLREESPQPLKSLADLEKIGLSSKQVHDMFRRAARGIFA